MNNPHIPEPIKRAAMEADAAIRRIADYIAMHPKPGPVPQGRGYRPGAFFSAGSEEELDELIAAHAAAVGKKEKGNKRRAASRFYADLVQDFYLLHRKGVTLPRNKSLSRKAVMFGLGETLRKHGYTSGSDDWLQRNGQERQRIANALDRVFTRVAASIEKKTPPQ